MESSQGQRRPAQLGATFYPGGTDDFYMPEVISPAPQRIMPEVPKQMQGNLAHLELEADSRQRNSGLQSSYTVAEMPGSTLEAQTSSLSISTESSEAPQGHPNSNNFGTYSQPQHQVNQEYTTEHPSFTPFPPIQNRPPNVPPPDSERESILENARLPVLNSNDPDLQLTWAQDVLAYVEIAAQNLLRDSDSQDSRPQTPRIEFQLRSDAISVVSFLADQFHPKADFMRGMWLEFGKFNFRMDKKEAYKCYTRAAQKGYARAEYRIGMQFESSNNIAKAIKHYKQGVDAGDSASHYVGCHGIISIPSIVAIESATNIGKRLGMMTLLGQHGQPLDYERGIHLIKSAAHTADENAPQGAYVLGMLQAREIPQINVPERYLPMSIPDARFNIEKAAYLGFAKAQAKMGSAYELCQLGCEFDPTLSLHYNALAAKQGEAEAEMATSKWFLCGYEGLFEKNEDLAFKYARRAASSSLATAEFAMGYFYEIGMHVPVDLNKAREWYVKAADHGNKDAAGRIDGISRSKTLKKDHANVAIAQIRSQYGSQRGNRPERFRQNSTPMPTIPDNPVDMPEPYQSQPGGQVAPPYPHTLTDLPPSRPISVAPYPVDDGLDLQPRLRPANATANSVPNLRLETDPRRSSAAGFSPAPSDVNYQRFPVMGPHRPMSSAGEMGYGRGRGRPTFNTAPGPQSYRQPSGGLPSPPMVSPGPTNGSRPQPPGAEIGFVAPQEHIHSESGARPNPLEISRPHPSAVDIGFSAPPDLSGPDRKKRLQKPESRSSSTAPGFEGGAPGRNSPRTSSLPHTQTFSNRAPSPSQRPMVADKHRDTMPNTAGPGQYSGSSVPLASYPPTGLAPITGTPPPPSSSHNAASRPAGHGPKTFEDMNIPIAKKDSECVVM